MTPLVSGLGLIRKLCGGAHTLVQDHVLGFTRTILFEAACDDRGDLHSPPCVAFRFGNESDLAVFTQETHDYSPAQKQFGFKHLKAGDSLIVGEYKGAVAFYGWLMYGKADLDQDVLAPVLPDIAYCYRLFTVRGLRGLRICGSYYTYIKPLLRQQGYHRLICRIAPRNEASIRAHERAGFQRRGVLWKVTVPGHSFYYADPLARLWWPAASEAACFSRHGILRQTATTRVSVDPYHQRG